jgi:NADPH-dependent glutamate synthase beta subunit-like oxidoreductase
MRMLPGEVAIQSFAEVAEGYSRAEAMAEARRVGDRDFADARAACPFGVDVTRLVQTVAAGDFDGALGVVMAAHPWPGILGRWCHRPCEAAPRLGPGVEPPSIGALERAAADHGARARGPFAAGSATGRRVAIVGAGSAASAAAYRLRQIGHAVAIYEQLPVSGGMMFVGYPDFRLPRAVLWADNSPEAWGVEMHYDVRVEAALIDELVAAYDAVLLAAGKFQEIPLDVPGEELEGVWSALDFLIQFKLGRAPRLGRRVIVVGAGYTAQDASRTCRRLGAAVAILYRRTAEEMPVRADARARYLARQVAEGAPFVFQVDVVRILGEQGKVVGVECVRTEPGPPDADGRRSPVRVAGTEHVLPCDTVIAATGERVDLTSLPPAVRLQDAAHVWVEPATGMTSVPKLFAAGEMTGISGTQGAFKSGFLVAETIDRFLRASAVPPGAAAGAE